MSEATANPMQALLADAKAVPVPPKPGQLVDCAIISVKPNRIIVEIANAYTGIIQGREAIDGLGTAKHLQPGDHTQAFVVEDENDAGYFVLSLRKAGRERAWDQLLEWNASGEAIEVRIKEANKGGLMTEVAGIRAFIPVSQLAPEHYPRVNGANAAEILRRLQDYVGEKFIVKVLTVDKNDGKLILSERAAISERRATALTKLKVGQKVKGQVSGIVQFGIFLLFGDHLEGLVHLSEIAWGHVSDPAAHARLGEEKEAVVIGVEGDKISLSIKRLTQDPWQDLVKDMKEGDVMTGTIAKVTPFGAFVEIAKDVQGLVPMSEIAVTGDEVAVEVGQSVEVTIRSIDVAEHRIGLNMKKKEETEEKKPAKKAAKKEEVAVEEAAAE